KLAAIGDDAQRNALIAIGETDEITTTPIELSVAMLSLVGGKSPVKPHIGDIKTPIAESPGEPTSSSILIGMRGCLEYGTGTKQRNWKELPFTVIGKTGTPTIPGNTVTYGWFSGVSIAEHGAQAGSPGIVVTVFLERGHGAEAASIAFDVFKAYSKEPALSVDKIGVSARSKTELSVSLFDPLRPAELTVRSSAPITFRDETTNETLLHASAGIQPLQFRIIYQPDGYLRIAGASLNTALRDNRIKFSRVKIDADDGGSIEARVGGSMSRRFGS